MWAIRTDKRDLHGEDQAKNEESSVRRVDAVRKSTHEQKNENMEGNQVNDEHITTPCWDLKIK